MRKKRVLLCLLLFLVPVVLDALPGGTVGAAGILVPTEFYEELGIELLHESIVVEIQDLFVHTKVTQIFYNSDSSVREGMYMFTLPADAFLTAFATWDEEIRLAGKMLEKEPARQIYTKLQSLYIDPGLLEQVDDNLFETRIFPIPGYGTKRVELEYRQTLLREGGRVVYSYPLLTGGESRRIDNLDYRLNMTGQMKPVNIKTNLAGIDIKEHSHGVDLYFAAQDYRPEQDLYLTWDLPGEEFIYQAGREEGQGILMLTLLPETKIAALPSRYHLALDRSGSMMGWPFVKMIQLAENFLEELRDCDYFNISAWAIDSIYLWPEPRPATAANIAQARNWLAGLEFVREGTDLQKALKSMHHLPRDTKVILLTDGQATFGATRREAILAVCPPHLDISVVALGHQVQSSLLRSLVDDGGNFYLAGEGASPEEIMKSLLAGLYSCRLTDINVLVSPSLPKLEFLPGPATVKLGSQLILFANFAQPGRGFVTIEGLAEGVKKEYSTLVELPLASHSDDFLLYHWARARIDTLLSWLEEEKNDEWQKEVVDLSCQFNIVTPYTSFLAAPRAVLRPRVIKPGDPLLSVQAPADTTAVTVIFPFGETVNTTYNSNSKLWECRFLVPKGFKDGVYAATIIVVSSGGEQVITTQSFIIDSEPPTVEAKLKSAGIKPGEQTEIWADASSDTIILTATMPWREEIDLRWDPSILHSRGYFTVPRGWAPGKYKIRITATDRAFNMSGTEVELIVLPTGEVD